MNEQIPESEYYSMQHFISESPWDYRLGFDKVARDTTALFEDFHWVGLLLDETAHTKKGVESVGVSRQWSGQLGKVDNCQVSVMAALSTGKYYCPVDTRLFLPECWTLDKKRCKKAGVPKERQQHKTKQELALEMVIHQRKIGTRFDWVGADGLYGHDFWFTEQLDKLGENFMLDIHSDQHLYIQEPELQVPERTTSKGRKPSKLKANEKAIEARGLINTIPETEWETIVLRNTPDGEVLKADYWFKPVFVWDGFNDYCLERMLVIRRNKTSKGFEYKYSLTNAKEGDYLHMRLACMQGQRFFIEQAFRDCKQEIGMSQYQVRGWLAWHHHMTLVMMALFFVTSEKVRCCNELPLLSAYDIREIMITVYPKKAATHQDVMEQIRIRHAQRLGKPKSYV
jgi:SRSO17 transposase